MPDPRPIPDPSVPVTGETPEAVGSSVPHSPTMGSAPTSDSAGSEPEQSLPELPAGLHITRCIASGGQGIVYEAVRDQPHQIVALKVPRIRSDPAARGQALAHEADLLANLSHPNIVKVFEVVPARIDGHRVPCVVMERVEDELPITRFALVHGLGQAERVRLFIKACRAVQHMHERLHAYHRDLKPGNLLVGRDGEPKLIDVGLAVLGDPDQRLQLRGTVMGTIDYMAPEQFARDTAYLTQRTDVYALGVILFELLTGKLPYDLRELTFIQKQAVITTTPPRKLADHCALEFPALAHVVEVALRKETAAHPDQQRWPTPGSLANELESAFRRPASGDSSTDHRQAVHPVSLAETQPARWSLLRFPVAIGLAVCCTLAALAWADPIAGALGLKDRFENWALSSVPPAVQHQPLRSTAVVAFQSVEEVGRVAARFSAENPNSPAVNLEDPPTWRHLYAALLDALGPAEPAVVAFDIVLNNPNPRDALLRAAADRHPTVPIVTALDAGRFEMLTDSPVVSDFIARPVMWGTVSAECVAGWWFDLLLQRGTQTPRASLALQAAAAAKAPPGDRRFTVDRDATTIRIDTDRIDPRFGPQPGAPTWSVPLTGSSVIQEASAEEIALFGTRPGDTVYQTLVVMPEQKELDAISHSVEEVMDASPATRVEWFKGRGVFIANCTPLASDQFAYPDGREIWGVYGHAVAYDSMRAGTGVTRPRPNIAMGLTLLGAAAPLLGLIAGARSLGSIGLTVTLAIATAAAMPLIGGWLLTKHLVYFPGFSVSAAALCSACIACAVIAAGTVRARALKLKGMGEGMERNST